MCKKAILPAVGLVLTLSFFGSAPGCRPAPACPAQTDTAAAQTVTLLFAGDLMQHQAQIDAARTAQGYDYSPCFKHVKDELNKADFAIGNLEVTLGGKPYKGYPAFSAPDEYLTAIRAAGFNVLLTANNHCLDRGKKGLQRTLHLLDSLGIPHTGTYKDSLQRAERSPLVLEKNGCRIALLNYTYGTNGLRPARPNIVNYIDTAIIAQDIRQCRQQQADLVIACMHWGTEYESLPNAAQKQLARWLFNKGVDHIVGAHPHVVQPIEVQADSLSGQHRLVAYSLGNFISNMSARHTDGGLMLQMTFARHDNCWTLDSCHYSLVWTARPRLTNEKNFYLLPAGMPTDSLPAAARQRMSRFVKDARTLMKSHNQGIAERLIPAADTFR